MSDVDLFIKMKTEFDKNSLLLLIELFIKMKYPSIEELDVRYDNKGKIWIRFFGVENHKQEVVQKYLSELQKELNHYAEHK